VPGGISPRAALEEYRDDAEIDEHRVIETVPGIDDEELLRHLPHGVIPRLIDQGIRLAQGVHAEDHEHQQGSLHVDVAVPLVGLDDRQNEHVDDYHVEQFQHVHHGVGLQRGRVLPKHGYAQDTHEESGRAEVRPHNDARGGIRQHVQDERHAAAGKGCRGQRLREHRDEDQQSKPAGQVRGPGAPMHTGRGIEVAGGSPGQVLAEGHHAEVLEHLPNHLRRGGRVGEYRVCVGRDQEHYEA